MIQPNKFKCPNIKWNPGPRDNNTISGRKLTVAALATLAVISVLAISLILASPFLPLALAGIVVSGVILLGGPTIAFSVLGGLALASTIAAIVLGKCSGQPQAYFDTAAARGELVNEL